MQGLFLNYNKAVFEAIADHGNGMACAAEVVYDLVDRLIATGTFDADGAIAAGGEGGSGAMSLALFVGHPGMLRRLLEAGASTEDYRGSPLLCLAANGCSQRDQTIGILLDVGLDPNATDTDGCAPLWIAVNNRRTQCVEEIKQLLAAGADPDTTGGRATSWRCTDGHHATPLNVLAYAVGREASELVMTLLSGGADPRKHGAQIHSYSTTMETLYGKTIPVHEFARLIGSSEKTVALLREAVGRLDAIEEEAKLDSDTLKPVSTGGAQRRL